MDLVEIRTKSGLSQTAVAELVGTSQIYISKIENGKAFPSKGFQKRFEGVFADEVDWLQTRLKGTACNGSSRIIVEQVLDFIHGTDPMDKEEKKSFISSVIESL